MDDFSCSISVISNSRESRALPGPLSVKDIFYGSSELLSLLASQRFSDEFPSFNYDSISEEKRAEIYAFAWSNPTAVLRKHKDRIKYGFGVDRDVYCDGRNVSYSTFLKKLSETVSFNFKKKDPQHRISLLEFNLNFNWMRTMRGIRLHRNEDFQARDFFAFFFDVSKSLVSLQYNNINFIAHLMELACDMCEETEVFVKSTEYNRTRESLSEHTRTREFHEYHLITLTTEESRMSITEMKKLLVLPYKTAHHELNRKYDEVMKAATSGNIGLLEILLKFGATMLQPKDNQIEREHMNYTLNTLLRLQFRPQFFENNLELFFNTTSRRRFFLVLRALEILTKIRRQPIYTRLYVRSLELLFKSIPDPIISVKEIEDSLKKVGGDAVWDGSIFSLCKEFKHYFPKSSRPPQPRSLKHLVRCHIRDNIRARESCFPNEVNALPLPTYIKNYIMLKEENFPSPNPVVYVTRHYCGQQVHSNFDGLLHCNINCVLNSAFLENDEFLYEQQISNRLDYVIHSQ